MKLPKLFLFFISVHIVLSVIAIYFYGLEKSWLHLTVNVLGVMICIGAYKGLRVCLLYFRAINYALITFFTLGLVDHFYPNFPGDWSLDLNISFKEYVNIHLTGLDAAILCYCLFAVYSFSLYNKTTREYCCIRLIDSSQNSILSIAKNLVARFQVPIAFFTSGIASLFIGYQLYFKHIESVVSETYLMTVSSFLDVIAAKFNREEIEYDKLVRVVAEQHLKAVQSLRNEAEEIPLNQTLIESIHKAVDDINENTTYTLHSK